MVCAGQSSSRSSPKAAIIPTRDVKFIAVSLLVSALK